MKHKLIIPILIANLLVLLIIGGVVYMEVENDENPVDLLCSPIESDNFTQELVEFDKYIIRLQNTSNTTVYENCTKKHANPEVSFSQSVFFIFTAITTIGYGNITPKTDGGKIFTIVISYIGIPLNIAILAKIGELLKRFITYLLKPIQVKVKKHKYFILIQVCVVLPIGKIIFLFIPAVFIMYMEQWTYIEALYYTFVTVFTIGFGDYIAAYNEKVNVPNVFYEIAVYLWIYLSMAYISLLVNLIIEYLSENAATLHKEIREILTEKLSMHNYMLVNRRRPHIDHKCVAVSRKKPNLFRFIQRSSHALVNNTELNDNQLQVTININTDEIINEAVVRFSRRNSLSNSRRSSIFRQNLRNSFRKATKIESLDTEENVCV